MEHLKALRERLGLTQAELAAGIGVSQSNVSHYELGKQEFPVSVARRLIAFLETKGVHLTFDDLYAPVVRPAADEPEPERRGPNLPKSGNGPSPGMEQSRNETGSRTQSGIEASPATSTSEATACRA